MQGEREIKDRVESYVEDDDDDDHCIAMIMMTMTKIALKRNCIGEPIGDRSNIVLRLRC